MTARFEALLDCGDDDRIPEWEVIEWDYTNPENGSRYGHCVARAENELDAKQQAAFLNAARELESLEYQECEFDC